MRDHWIFGPGNHVQFTTSGPVYLGQVTMWSREGVSSISDSSGNLLAYAYPGAVFHAGLDTVINGTLNWSCVDEGGSSTTQGSMFLPGENGILHLFTIRGDSTGCGRYLYHDSIRISPATGLAELVSPARKPVLPIQISERLTAVRHGNGKDWWVITTNAVGVSRGLSDQLLVFHLSQDTLLLESTIEIQDTRIYGELIAAPNGSLLALANVQFTRDTIECSLTILDFDRCVGSATLLRLYDFNRGIYSVEFSKSGEYLYMSTQDNSNIDCGIFQLDVEDSLSIPQRVYDCRDYIGRVVGQMERGPNGKIYFAISNNYTDPLIGFLNVISSPDLEGTACNVIEGCLSIAPSFFYYASLPNHPNYYLGPDPRCSGDTTTTDTTSAIAPVPGVPTWKVYPTVSEGTVTVETSSPGGDITVLDAMGRIVLRTGLRAGRARWSTTAWPAGMYRVLLHRDGRYLGARTVVRP